MTLRKRTCKEAGSMVARFLITGDWGYTVWSSTNGMAINLVLHLVIWIMGYDLHYVVMVRVVHMILMPGPG
eukprot:CAMPEP_0180813200 /NCGR_PEP_ID=MMETSP1038_2-20121128/66411_1 /TAXON_ID=632150 /ORGANISM="Azadinium spinosum, Strain 3D9" /LENGTH=70 /DNA_ID=CAMNT_0022854781 /DNA_START=584 /DNA_END=797 /DNA_ORIENTATION=+